MMMISMMVGMMVGMTATAAQHAAEEMSLRTPLADLLQWKRMEEEAGRFTHFEAGMPCACALTEPSHPFEIDCGKEDMEHVLEAWRVLTSEPACMSAEGCLSQSNNSTCRQSFYVVQSHHDHCSHSDVPTEVEKGETHNGMHIEAQNLVQVTSRWRVTTALKSEHRLVRVMSCHTGYHDFDANCWHCYIQRKFTPGYPACPPVDCSNAALADFAAGVLQKACGVVPDDATLDQVQAVDCCNSPQEQSAFQLVLSLHDLCGPTAPPVVDRLLHDYEYSCSEYFCNSSTESYQPDVCTIDESKRDSGDNGGD